MYTFFVIILSLSSYSLNISILCGLPHNQASPIISIFPELIVVSFHILPFLCVTSLITCSSLDLMQEPYSVLEHLLACRFIFTIINFKLIIIFYFIFFPVWSLFLYFLQISSLVCYCSNICCGYVHFSTPYVNMGIYSSNF
jgi:hypothetical protein